MVNPKPPSPTETVSRKACQAAGCRAACRARLPFAERTRERILEAALVEFGEHGFGGARTSAIAARAGVNQQLISYYFDGKEGLFRALQRRWETTSGAARTDVPMAEVVAEFVRLAATQRSWARLLAWEGLADTGAEPDADDGQ